MQISLSETIDDGTAFRQSSKLLMVGTFISSALIRIV